ncbi:hypothetical protein ABT246_08285 [Streptomyces sp. NPDC001553]|uniref:hypothetical protein n=1 Tax=Streptomyces sp. NPDC001553 TaxID=3154385 RepID=UPI00331D9D3D
MNPTVARYQRALDGVHEESVDACLAAVTPMAGRFAATGMYAPAVPLPGHASPRQRLLGLLGRRDDV